MACCIRVFGLIFIIIFSKTYAGKQFDVTFINPTGQGDIFWQRVTNLMKAACEDLNCNLNVLYTPNRNHALAVKYVNQMGSSEKKPDYLVFQSTKLNGIEILKLAEDKKIKNFIFNAGLNDKQRKRYGGPRQHFKYWIGEMLPDDWQAGHDTAKALVEHADQKQPGSLINILGLQGVAADGASIERVKGLRSYVKTHVNVDLKQLTAANWSKKTATRKFKGLYKRYPEIRYYWSANDEMAEGIISGANKAGLTPGTDLWVTGVDWDISTIQRIKNGEFIASAGGHFLEAIWVIVLLADYHNGIDFKSDSLRFKSKMTVMTKDNVDEYVKKLSLDEIEAIDFRKFSKFYNKDIKTYNFEIFE